MQRGNEAGIEEMAVERMDVGGSEGKYSRYNDSRRIGSFEVNV